jgi:hypothetical protein
MLWTEIFISDPNPIPELSFVPEQEYLELYKQVGEISFMWKPDKDNQESIDKILNDPFTQQIMEDESFGKEYMLEQLEGKLIVPSILKNKGMGYTYALANLVDVEDYIPISIQADVVALMKIENGVMQETVTIFHESAEKLIPTSLRISEYFHLDYACKSFANWQLAYCYGKDSLYSELLRYYVPLFFPLPDLDLSAWEKERKI